MTTTAGSIKSGELVWRRRQKEGSSKKSGQEISLSSSLSNQNRLIRCNLASDSNWRKVGRDLCRSVFNGMSRHHLRAQYVCISSVPAHDICQGDNIFYADIQSPRKAQRLFFVRQQQEHLAPIVNFPIFSFFPSFFLSISLSFLRRNNFSSIFCPPPSRL
jgi:hypothetical protein